MEYLTPILLIAGLILIIYLGTSKKYKKEESKLQSIKKTVRLSILVNSVILTPLILSKSKGTLFDISFFWLINFVVPYLAFERLFNEDK